ncbi:sensor histidine kinase [Plebeiibacterium marinum]|uniref:histidine kinase n=1 Tax=Plebeiibacterium marinum TaxID=2992111 RepID=A0AAE3MAT9_9BACT|nr:HAMP domain-containing sensor histidine kinase [Plebeiobacterium marinum]MCW3804229.1 HAMP domain-containing histidine kinase [Plebeiobacterium marinum]
MEWQEDKYKEDKDYVLWLFYSNKQYIRSLFVILLVVFPAFSMLDYYSNPISFNNLLYIRIFIGIPILAIPIILSYTEKIQVYLRIINATALFIINLSISLMYFFIKPEEYAFNTFYSGLMITTASLSLSMSRVNLTNWYIILSTIVFILVSVFKHDLIYENKLLFIKSSTFLVASSAFWIFANTVINRFARKLYDAQKKISQEKDLIHFQKDKFERLNTTKDQFLSIISHDLRSPFNTLIGYFSIMLQNKQEQFTVKREEIQRIYFHIRRTYNLLNNILIWSRSQLRNNYFQPQTYVIKDIIFENKELYMEIASAKNISLTYIVDDYEFVYCDRDMISTIIRNLILNSIKFSNYGGEITIRAQKESNFTIEFAIIDNGIGMSPQVRKKLLKAEEQYSTPGTEREEGSGIGLMICKEFLNVHGTDLKIDSKQGIGSKFYFILPANENTFKSQQNQNTD